LGPSKQKNVLCRRKKNFQPGRANTLSHFLWLLGYVEADKRRSYCAGRIRVASGMLWSQFSAIFDNFWRKNWRFFSKTNVMIKILHNLALFRVKNANFFAKFFGENILKNHNIGPWTGWRLWKNCPKLWNT
jgi:hypothetical protein